MERMTGLEPAVLCLEGRCVCHYATSAYFMPQSGQLEVTFRYNDDVIKNLNNAYPMSVNDSGEQFIFVISDNQNKKYTTYEYISKEKANYNYRRLIFSGIDFTNVSTLYIDVYYINDVTLSKPYRSMLIYDSNLTLESYTKKIPTSVTAQLVEMPKYVINEEKQF